MNDIKWNLLILAIIGVFSIIGIGISFATRSITGGIICTLIFLFIMAVGIKTKKQMVENGKL